jgi:hypothetical protein
MTLNMNIFLNPAFYVFLTTFTSFILLLLISVSVPLVSSFYFLYSSQANGVRFGLWGWCLDSDGTCSSPLQLGYTWEPEIVTQITGALAFYPFSVALAFLTTMSLLPVLCFQRKFGDTAFRFLAWTSMATSALAFLFMVGIASVAKQKFEQQGFKASYGNLHVFSLAATLLLLAAAVSPYVLSIPDERSHSSRSDLESRPSTRRREISRRPLEEKGY